MPWRGEQLSVNDWALKPQYLLHIVGFSGYVSRWQCGCQKCASILGQLRAHWDWVFLLIVVIFPLSLCLYAAGKPLPYMPYDMMLAVDQETHSGQPGSPYRLSPRELRKASPDPNAPNVSCYSVPPGKSTHFHLLLPTLFASSHDPADTGRPCLTPLFYLCYRFFWLHW